LFKKDESGPLSEIQPVIVSELMLALRRGIAGMLGEGEGESEGGGGEGGEGEGGDGSSDGGGGGGGGGEGEGCSGHSARIES
jgi:hypothetical protein